MTEINFVTESQRMLNIEILNGIAVYPFSIMEQERTDKDHRNIHVHRTDVQVGIHKPPSKYILIHFFMRCCCTCWKFILSFLADSNSFTSGT